MKNTLAISIVHHHFVKKKKRKNTLPFHNQQKAVHGLVVNSTTCQKFMSLGFSYKQIQTSNFRQIQQANQLLIYAFFLFFLKKKKKSYELVFAKF